MPQIKFLYGRNLAEKQQSQDTTQHIPFSAGTLYLDLETGELYFDAPDTQSATGSHTKIIDSATLVYTKIDSIMFPSESENGGSLSGSTSAKLGVAILGSMKLGIE